MNEMFQSSKLHSQMNFLTSPQTPRNTARRNIQGISEAIREKAFKSTSPSSEIKDQKSAALNSRSLPHKPKKKEIDTLKPLTVQERLRKLLPSEADSTDEQSLFDNQYIYQRSRSEMPIRMRSKTPTPHQKIQTLNRHEEIKFHQNYKKSNLQTPQYPDSTTRRCKSAVPAVFHDKDWNKVAEYPISPKNPPQFHMIRNHPLESQPGINPQAKQSSNHNPSLATYQIVVKAPPGGGKPVPAVRRSLHIDSGFDSSRSTVGRSQDQLQSYQQEIEKMSKQISDRSKSQEHLLQKTPNGRYSQTPIAQLRKYPNVNQVDRCTTPSRRHKKDLSPKSVPRSSQQNISFRRALNHNSSDEDSPLRVAAVPNVTRVTSSGQTSLSSTTKVTAKSDDRDSGTVLEHSIFDDDSSGICPHLEGNVSRSQTPILPPLPPEDDTNVTEEDLKIKEDISVIAGYKVPNFMKKSKESTPQSFGNVSTIVRSHEKKIKHKAEIKHSRHRGKESESSVESTANTHNYHCSKNNITNSGSLKKEHVGDSCETESIVSLTTASICSSAARSRSKRGKHGCKRSIQFGRGEKYTKEMRSMNKRLMKLEGQVTQLSKNLTLISNELQHQIATTKQIDQLRNEIKELRLRQNNSDQLQQKLSSKKSSKDSTKFNKLSKLFSEPQQPSVLYMFLKRLGYEKYVKNLQQHSIGMSELPYIDDKQLEAIGIPLGPRIRILTEAKKSSFV